MKATYIALALAIPAIFGCGGSPDRKGAGSDSASLVKAAKDAYIFAYPQVMMYRSLYLQALAPKDGVGFGNWLHLGASVPEDTTIVTPNNDSPYSYAWLDLRTEPYVLTMPPIEDNRFYTSQWDDMFGYVLDNAGSVKDGNDGVSVLLAAPDFKGDLPDGVKRLIKGDSYLLGTLTRTQLIGQADLPNVQKIQRAYKLQPLSRFLGTQAPAPAPAIDWMEWKEGAEFKDDFWKYAGFVSRFLVGHPEDKEKWDQLEQFGFMQGGDWSIAELDPEKQEALREGQKQAIAFLGEKVSSDFDAKKFFNNREGMKHIGDDDPYVQRAMGVMAGIFGNTKDISVYYGFQKDAAGNIPDASKAPYTLTFKPGQLPNVKNFWSITMYRLPQRWFVPNDIKRYSIGSASPDMKLNPDKSLTLYLQPTSPGPDKAGNWLPTPDGPFWFVLRCYGPDQSIIDGTWPEPVLQPNL